MIFLDQPVGTGFSYSSDRTAVVNNTPDAAMDVWAFLQLLFKMFPEVSLTWDIYSNALRL